MNKEIKKHLKEQKELGLKGNLYHVTQVKFAYNSNHIEGSKLSEEQTNLIFETNTILEDETGNPIQVDDIMETSSHFRLFDFLIDTCDEKLTIAMIKQMHKILKEGTSDAKKRWFNVGDFKKLPNVIGGDIETTAPEFVQEEIEKLLLDYQNKEVISVDDVIDFHVRFEKIHPFQDGNGRVGRAIMFKECLKNDIVPFIIEDEKKALYYRGLKEYKNEKGFLIDTCLYFQDRYEEYYDNLIGNYLEKDEETEEKELG